MKNKISTKLALAALVTAFAMPALAQQAPASTDTSANQDKVVDVVTGVKWLGRKLGHGTKTSLKFVYKKGLRPLAIGVEDAADMGAKGTIFVAMEFKKGTVVVEHGIQDGVEITLDDAIRPYIVKPVTEAGRVIVLDGAYKMVLKPIGVGLRETAQNDVVTGVRAVGPSEKDGAVTASREVKRDSVAVYDVTLKPVGEALAVGASATGTAIGHGARKTAHGVAWFADCFRDQPRMCKSNDSGAEMSAEDQD